MASAGEPGG